MDLLPPANTPNPAQINAALLILRIASALAFLYHGSGILFGAFGGPGPQKFSALMHMPVVVGKWLNSNKGTKTLTGFSLSGNHSGSISIGFKWSAFLTPPKEEARVPYNIYGPECVTKM